VGSFVGGRVCAKAKATAVLSAGVGEFVCPADAIVVGDFVGAAVVLEESTIRWNIFT
jgi:hypothetical protein